MRKRIKTDMNVLYVGCKGNQVFWNVDFDYAFGIAAVRVGRPGRAIFALERVLWRQPKNHRARLELARAQFDLGNIGVARDEFRAVLEHDPPENVRKN